MARPKQKSRKSKQFGYGLGDEAQDLASQADDVTQTINKVSEAVVNGAVIVVAVGVDGVEAVLGVNEGASFTEYMYEQTAAGVSDAIDYESEVGQRVLDSFKPDTFEEAPNYVLDTGLAALELIPGAKIAKDSVNMLGKALVERIADAGPKLDDSLAVAIKKSSDVPPKK